MNFRPTPVPIDPGGFRNWLAEQLRQIASCLAAPSVASIHFDVLHAAPAKIWDGDVVCADGVDWNPGSGAGLYARVNGAWVKL
jgi:hypothetical protein